MKSLTFYRPDGVSKTTEVILESTLKNQIDRIFLTEKQTQDLMEALCKGKEIRLEYYAGIKS